MHVADCDCAPVAENLTRQGDALAAAEASGIRVPARSASAILIGTACPSFHFDRGTGEKKPSTRYSKTSVSALGPMLPALSVAVQSSVCTPGVLVSTASQLELATPDIASVAFGAAAT